MGKGAALLALIIFFLLSFPLLPQEAKQKIDESYLVPPLHYIAQGLIRIGKTKILPQEDSTVRDGSTVPSSRAQAEGSSPSNGEGVGYF